MNKKAIPIIKKYSLLSGVLILIFLLVILASKLTKQQSDTASNITAKKEVVENIVMDAPSDDLSKMEDSTSKNVTLEATENVNELDESVINEINDLVTNYYNPTAKLDENLLVEGVKENKKVVKAISEKREGIEAYKNIKTYVRLGMEEKSYVVFSTYDMKFLNIDTLAPGMSVLYVINKQGDYVIQEDTSAANLSVYINELSQEEEIVNIIEQVNTDLVNAMKRDDALKGFIEKLKEVSKE